jgi:uncharacterized protein with ATP-grasp and redox domains
MGGALNRIMAQELGVEDPYVAEKRRTNAEALALLPALEAMVEAAPRPFQAAVKLAIAANVIDFGAPGGDADGDLRARFEAALSRELAAGGRVCADALEEASGRARRVLYLADNAGEIAVDRLLVSRFVPGTVTVAVRGGPAINDALLEDAREVGMHAHAAVVASGSALPGTVLARTSDGFRRLFGEADLIVSKGQGNYETLCDEDAPIFFLLMAKCPVVAAHLGCEVGDYVAARNGRLPRNPR